jgi:hypothetical protein
MEIWKVNIEPETNFLRRFASGSCAFVFPSLFVAVPAETSSK